MSTKRVIARNALWNWAGMITPMLAGFVVAPFLVHRLGDTTYGLWILIGSVAGYYGILDFGIRDSVGRNVALFLAKRDPVGVNRVLNTAGAILGAAGLIALLATFGVLLFFFRIFDVPPDQVADARLALVLVGINFAMSLPASLFDATLWAYQRYDLRNGLDIVTVLVRTVLTFTLIGNGGGLVTLAVLTLAISVANTAVRVFFVFRLDPALRAGLDYVRLDAARGLYGYGVWAFLLNMARLVIPQFSPFIVGSRLGVDLVTPYGIATRLIGYGTMGLKAGTSVLTPVATALHAEEKRGQQQRLFLEAGKYCLALALFFATLFVLLGRPFITLWMGPSLAYSAGLLTILALGEVLPMSQWVTYSILLGMGRHRVPAIVAVLENVVVIGAALALAHPYGLAGVCLAVAVPGALCRGLIQLLYACHVLHVSPGTYLRRTLLPPLASAVLPALGLAALTRCSIPTSWAQLIAYGALYGAAYAAFGLFFVGDDRLRQRLLGLARKAVGNRPAVVPMVSAAAVTEGSSPA